MTATFDLSTLVDRLAGPAGLKLSLALLHFLWQGVLIAAAAAVLMRVLGRRSASRRYAIGVAGMALMATAPVITFCVVTPPALSPTDLTGAAASDELLSEIARLDAMLAALDVAPGEEHGTDESASEPIVPARPLTWPERIRLWQPYALLVWLAGTGLFALRLGVGVRASRRFGRGRRPLPEAWLKTVAEVAGRVGLKAPRVFIADGAIEAVAVGLLRPMVLIPAAWLGRVPPEVLEAVLAHELAHLRRHDLWVNLLQRCVEAALFYHPAVWWLSRRVRVEREYCCDETAALAVSGRAAYARALEFVAAEAVAVRAAAAARPALRPALAAGMGGESMALLDRVKRVLGADVGPPRGNWMSEGLLALAVPAALWAGIAAVGPAVARADQAEEKAAADRAYREDAADDPQSDDVLILRDGEEEEGQFEVDLGDNPDVLVLPADMPWEEAQRLIEERKNKNGDVVVLRAGSDVLTQEREQRGVPILKDIPLVGRLFTMENSDIDTGADTLIAGNRMEGEEREAADEDDGDDDDVRAALRELRDELKSLRKEVEQLRGGEDRRVDEKRYRYEVRPSPPMPKGPPGEPGELRLEARQHDGFGDMFILRKPNPDGGPARFEVRVLRMDKDGTEPERLIERLHVENADGQPRIFLFREGQDGKPEKVEGKSDGDETVIKTEEGEIRVRPLHKYHRQTAATVNIDGKEMPAVVEEDSDDPLSPKKELRVRILKPAPPGSDVRPNPGIEPDRRDDVIRKLEQELQRLRQELEKARTGKIESGQDAEAIARMKAEAEEQVRRAEIAVKLQALHNEDALLQQNLGENHPKRIAIRKQIEILEQALKSGRSEGLEEQGESRNEAGTQTRVFALKHLLAEQVAASINKDNHPIDGSEAAADSRTNSVIVSGSEEGIERIAAALKELDSLEGANRFAEAQARDSFDALKESLNRLDAPPEAREALVQKMRQLMEQAGTDGERARRDVEAMTKRAEALRQQAEAQTRQADAAREAVAGSEQERAEAARADQEQAEKAVQDAQAAALAEQYKELIAQKRFDEAIAIARKAHEVAPDARETMRMLRQAEALLEQARAEDAVREAEAARKAAEEADRANAEKQRQDAEARERAQESQAEPEQAPPQSDTAYARKAAEVAETEYLRAFEANTLARSKGGQEPISEAQLEYLRVTAEAKKIEAENRRSQGQDASAGSPKTEAIGDPQAPAESEPEVFLDSAKQPFAFFVGLFR